VPLTLRISLQILWPANPAGTRFLDQRPILFGSHPIPVSSTMNLEVCSQLEEDPGELDLDAMLKELDQERHSDCGSWRYSSKCRTPRKGKRPVVYQPHTMWMCFPVSSNARGPRFNKTCFHSDGRGRIFPPFGQAARPARDEDDPNELRSAVLVDPARVAWNCISARVERRAFAKGEVLQMSVSQPTDGGEATFQAACSCNGDGQHYNSHGQSKVGL
jgi:hypothetical protein